MIKYSHIKDSCSNFSGSRKINILAVGARKKKPTLVVGDRKQNLLKLHVHNITVTEHAPFR